MLIIQLLTMLPDLYGPEDPLSCSQGLFTDPYFRSDVSSPPNAPYILRYTSDLT
jgi:hypothetical protein